MEALHFPRPFSPFQATRDDYLLVLEQENRAPASIEKYTGVIAHLRRFGDERSGDSPLGIN